MVLVRIGRERVTRASCRNELKARSVQMGELLTVKIVQRSRRDNLRASHVVYVFGDAQEVILPYMDAMYKLLSGNLHARSLSLLLLSALAFQ